MRSLLFTFTITLTLCISLIQSAYSQKVVQLTNNATGKTKIIKQGQRVEYTLKFNPKIHYVGVIESITEEYVTVNGKSFNKDHLNSFGRKRKGSGFLAVTSSVIGAGLIVGAIASTGDDPCSGCTDEGSSGEEWVAIEIGMGLAILGLGINTAVRNSPRDLVTKWKFEIIDAPVIR